MKYSIIFLFLFAFSFAEAQKSINDYKYVIVPKKFSGFKKENQHRTSTLVKHLLSEKGLNAVHEQNLPEDLKMNRCLGLEADIIDDSSMFTTKTIVSLKDCNGQEIIASQQGTSKKKEYIASYSEALTKALQSFDGLDYSYVSNTVDNKPITVSFENDIKQLETTQKKQELDKYQDPMQKRSPTREEQDLSQVKPRTSNAEKDKEQGAKTMDAPPSLYAQPINNGYQLVDSSPRIRFKMYKSAIADIYHATSMDKSITGIIYTKNEKWFFEYYANESVVVEELRIKF